MRKILSERVERIAPSATFAVKAKAQELKAKGADVINFGTGEPNFDTPPHIKEAAKRALDEGFTKYTAIAGINELREAIAEKMRKENKVECSRDNVITCNGAKHALYNVFQVLLNPNDEVLILSPYWVSYPGQVRLAGGKPVFVGFGGEMQPNVESIK